MTSEYLSEGGKMQIARLKISWDGLNRAFDLQLSDNAEALELNEIAYAFYFYLKDVRIPCGEIDDLLNASSLTIVFCGENELQKIYFCERYSEAAEELRTYPDALAKALLDQFREFDLKESDYMPAFNRHLADIAAARKTQNVNPTLTPN